MLFQANLSPNKLSRRVFLEQKKQTHLCLLASQQVSIAEIQQELVTLKKGGSVKRKGGRRKLQ